MALEWHACPMLRENLGSPDYESRSGTNAPTCLVTLPSVNHNLASSTTHGLTYFPPLEDHSILSQCLKWADGVLFSRIFRRALFAITGIMFIAIVGTRLAGKSTLRDYLVKHKAFLPVKILQTPSDKVSMVFHFRLTCADLDAICRAAGNPAVTRMVSQ